MWISKMIIWFLSVWAGLSLLLFGGYSPLLMISLLLLGLLFVRSLTSYSVKPSYHRSLTFFYYVFFIIFSILMTWEIIKIIRVV